jgi:AraC family transcriptional regulator, transcriptional activator of pobA
MDKPFHIFELTRELVEDIISRTYDSHFHDFEELIIVTQGNLEHFIDFKMEVLDAPVACYISKGKMHKLVPGSDLRGWVLNYKTAFIPDSKLSFYSNFLTSTNIPLSTGTCINRFISLCQIINGEYSQELVDYTSIRHLVSGLMAMIDTERKRNSPADSTAKASQVVTFNNFLKILEENYRRNEGVSYYAGKMNMSERNLNIVCRNNFRKSVSEIIESRKLTEAKRLLLYTDKSVSEIGYELGYNEKSYFTRVFHSKMEITPSRFREMTKGIIS